MLPDLALKIRHAAVRQQIMCTRQLLSVRAFSERATSKGHQGQPSIEHERVAAL